ncbi:uncharacterized protein Z518_07270 [Rhinocladiella mackenziei CBS 650.93]|uniref:Vacuolar protein sorting-associated protein 62 n=1 Tax=Rhinocladiella mackenziei CBS 650.93 TaxID=1442369 RepID=A0A0D2FNR1_9EURO|nr:uncharacterized protein Z518_07270 [Rhinocladiella mackenziei CBS 650.93]KIX03717.1 hypothetical protein Z518_07270 [Rhinocladiella mackenziei CBS 650.93]
MTGTKTKATIGVLSTIISYMCINSILRVTNPEAFIWSAEDREEASWIATSKSWIDRKCCRWLGVCGGAHVQFVTEGDRFGHRPVLKNRHRLVDPKPDWDWQHAWTEGNDRPEDWTDDERVLREIPDYVMEYAPLVHLYSGEQFWPCDVAEHLYHITPALNYTPLQSEQRHPNLNNLNQLNEWQNGRWVFLTSNDNVEERPEWLEGEKNIPSEPSNPDDLFEDNEGWVHKPGRTYVQGLKDAMADLKDWFGPDVEDLEQTKDFQMTFSGQSEESMAAHRVHHELRRSTIRDHAPGKIRGGRSDAPAVLVTVNKGHGIVDAFWFFFYSFNLGNVVLNIRFGNHVGDWEHTAIRFQHGKPKAVFFSEHNFGSAYSYDAVEKLGKRPVIYSAYGTHAMYSTPGTHPYILPWGILHDVTDRGPLWDPALNSHAYTYDYKADILRSSNLTPSAPTEWFQFRGRWGDKFYPLNDKRQYRFAGQYHYVNGPKGPKFKDLDRKKICAGPEESPCVIKNWLSSGDKIGRLHLTNENGEDDLYDL